MITIEIFYIVFKIICYAIILPYIYIITISAVTKDIIGKLVSANFNFNGFKLLNLYIGYTAGALIFTYIFYQLFNYKIVSLQSIDLPTIVSISALSFCFIARIITRQSGHVYGKQYVTTVTSLASILFLLNTINSLYSNNSTVSIYYIWDNLINRISNTLNLYKPIFDFIFWGALGTTIVGEVLLINIRPQARSIPVALEKFPSDFTVITGKQGIRDKMREMTDSTREIKSIKMITRTLEAFDNISSNLKASYEKSLSTFNHENYKIISPDLKDEQILEIYFSDPYIQFPFRYLRNVKNIKRIKSFFENEKKLKIEYYTKRKERLMGMKGKIVQHKYKDLKNFRLLIVNDEEALLT